jgi:hypothetical protein
MKTSNSGEKRTVLMSTAYLGPVEYFYYLNRFEKVIVEQYETWPKQTYRNRTVIVTDKGVQALTVPVEKVNGNHTKTFEIKISRREKWQIKHWRAIETAYSNSPYFLYYSDEIKEVLFSDIDKILYLNDALTKKICELTGIDCNITYSEDFVKNPQEKIFDLRNRISPKTPSTIKHFPEYIQVFPEKQSFIPNAGILDLLFCLGPETKSYLRKI